MAAPSVGAASGVATAIVLMLALAASVGFAIGLAISQGATMKTRAGVGTVCAVLALGAAGYAIWATGMVS